ncbi:hypothetical protein WICMUC_003963 [Wickerhamomyces mucosus]|uniref:Uncharacterized protein n=1 Tax=Wickerhamomyces mucosus TaxID=1378264 RepID=A0A9P8TC25_9ASCO|nr:hypothetical protein WICMUC_003963 [Wickerhamomyces mucosus]
MDNLDLKLMELDVGHKIQLELQDWFVMMAEIVEVVVDHMVQSLNCCHHYLSIEIVDVGDQRFTIDSSSLHGSKSPIQSVLGGDVDDVALVALGGFGIGNGTNSWGPGGA